MNRRAVFFILSFITIPISIDAKTVSICDIEDLSSISKSDNLVLYIQKRINLEGNTVYLPSNSKLVFMDGSCFYNGTIVGNSSSVKETGDNIFGNCNIEGFWRMNRSYSSMFDMDMETTTLIKNLARLSPVIKLSANRDYYICADNFEVELETIESEGREKVLIHFHTKNPNKAGIKIYGNNVVLRNIRFTDDYSVCNDVIYGNNDYTVGNMISVLSRTGNVQSLTIDGCDFSGGTSSSFVASSHTHNCYVINCSFSGYLGDHAVYCSKKVERFKVENCVIKDIIHTKGLFKIRSSKSVRSIVMKRIIAHNINGYMANISLLESPKCNIVIDSITVTKDSLYNGVFYGFCMNDETEQLMGKGSYNVNQILIKNCNFFYGYNGNPILYQGAGKLVCAKRISYLNTNTQYSNFTGGCTDSIVIKNCSFQNCCSDKGLPICTKSLIIDRSLISTDLSIPRLFILNYYSHWINSISFKNVKINAEAHCLFHVVDKASCSASFKRCDLTTIDRCLFKTREDSRIKIREKSNDTNFYESIEIIH